MIWALPQSVRKKVPLIACAIMMAWVFKCLSLLSSHREE